VATVDGVADSVLQCPYLPMFIFLVSITVYVSAYCYSIKFIIFIYMQLSFQIFSS
jgi:hypothetical protein